ncbi:MAG: C25 family cysteine peptidase [bacterium]|nr:C25 family cysteine peptidase [bacterium]
MRYNFLILLLLPAYLLAGEIQQTVRFKTSDLNFRKLKGYDIVGLNGCNFTRKLGSPMLPVKVISCLIPPGASIVKVEVISKESKVIPGKYQICPAQPPYPFSFREKVKWVEPDAKVYSGAGYFPTELIDYGHTGNMGGYRIIGIFVYPLQYIPVKGELIFNSRVELRVTYKEGVYAIPTITSEQKKLFNPMVKSMVINPEAVEIWAPDIEMVCNSKVLPPDTVEYVIITAGSFGSAFQPLADWKTKKGVPAKVVTREFIYANYTGIDDAERIRNFIKDANSNWGTTWVLLGGQCDFENGQEVIPRRDVWYWDYPDDYYPGEDTIPSDLYFSDLDGTWNADDDGIWGESTDGVDFYPDVFVGRAPVYDSVQATTFVNKVITYEKSPPFGYLKKILLPAVKLFPMYNYWGDTVNNAIARIDPIDWQDSKLYESLGNLSTAALVDSLNSGFGFMNSASHGWTNRLSYADGTVILNSDNVDNLINGDKLTIVLTGVACYCGAVDEVPGGDCFAEHFVNNNSGGAVAIIANTRYGWGEDAHIAFSDAIDTTFYHEFFCNNYQYHERIGVTNAMSKSRYISGITWEDWDVWPWCLYELTLFGDPELPMWSAEPESLFALYDTIITTEETNFKVEVTANGVGVDSAYVCIFKEGELYMRDYTDATGDVVFNLPSPLISPGTMWVTVTKHNFIPYEGVVNVVVPSGACVVYDHYEVNDSSGNNNGTVQPGEPIKLQVTIHNVGVDTAYQVEAVLRTADQYITIVDSTEDCGDVAPDSYKTGEFGLNVALSTPNCYNIAFELVISDKNNSEWVWHFSIPVVTPILKLHSYSIDDDMFGQSQGDGDKFLERGETIELITVLGNWGDIDAYNVNAVLFTYDTFVAIIDSESYFGDISHLDTVTAFDNFVFRLDRNCPNHHLVNLYLTISDIDTSTHDWIDSFYIKPVAPGDVMYGFYAPGDWSYGIASDGEKLWVTVAIPSLIYAVNPINGSVIKTIPAPGGYDCIGITYDSGFLWVNNEKTGKIYKIDTTGTIIKSFLARGSNGLTFDGEYLWTCHWGAHKIFKIDTANGNVLSSFTVPVPQPQVYGAMELAFEQNSQNLLLMMTFATQQGCDSCVVYEITRDGNLVSGHSFRGPLKRGTGVEYDKVTGDYWVLTLCGKGSISKVEGFYPWPPTQPGVDEILTKVPNSLVMYQNTPNPFAHLTSINYEVPVKSRVSLKVYDITGRLICTLVDRIHKPGYYRAIWDGKDSSGRRVSSGVYFYKFESKEFNKIMKLVFLK